MTQDNNTLSIAKLAPVLFAFFVMGFCDIVGISSDYAREAFGWSATMTGLVPSMVFVWFLFLAIPTGIGMGRLGRKNTVLASMAVTVVGMVLPLISYNATTCMLAYALLGIGNAMLQVSLNPLLQNVVTNERLLTSSLTVGQVVKAISSLCGPWIVALSITFFGGGDNQQWYLCFPVLGAITLLSGLWLMVTPIEREQQPAGGGSQLSDTFALLGDRRILLLFLGIFFVVGVDVATNFISSKLMVGRHGWSIAEAGMAPQVYFLSRTAGAFLGAFAMTKVSEMLYFRLNIVGAIISLLVLIFVSSATVSLVCIGAVGFFCSCVFAIIYSMALQAQPEKGNLISGLMITAVAGGGAVTPAIGVVTDSSGGSIVNGVWVIVLCVLYLTFCAFCLNTNKK